MNIKVEIKDHIVKKQENVRVGGSESVLSKVREWNELCSEDPYLAVITLPVPGHKPKVVRVGCNSLENVVGAVMNQIVQHKQDLCEVLLKELETSQKPKPKPKPEKPPEKLEKAVPKPQKPKDKK